MSSSRQIYPSWIWQKYRSPRLLVRTRRKLFSLGYAWIESGIASRSVGTRLIKQRTMQRRFLGVNSFLRDSFLPELFGRLPLSHYFLLFSVIFSFEVAYLEFDSVVGAGPVGQSPFFRAMPCIFSYILPVQRFQSKRLTCLLFGWGFRHLVS